MYSFESLVSMISRCSLMREWPDSSKASIVCCNTWKNYFMPRWLKKNRDFVKNREILSALNKRPKKEELRFIYITSGGVNSGSFSSFFRLRSCLPRFSIPPISSTHCNGNQNRKQNYAYNSTC